MRTARPTPSSPWWRTSARSGRAALELLAEDPHFDTLLCDVTMPDLSGVDVYERLAEQQPQLLPRLPRPAGQLPAARVLG